MNATHSEAPRGQSPPLLAVARRFAERNVTSRSALPIAMAVTLIAGVGDVLTRAETTFTLFYVVPLAIVTWFRSRRAAYLVIGEIMLISASVDVWLDRRHTTAPFIVWNLAIELGLYLVFAWMLDALRKRVALETELRQSAIDQLRHAERLTTLGKLAAGVAHELGTPMNVVSGRAALIATGRFTNEDAKRSGTIIVEQVDRMATIIRNLLDFARRGGSKKTRCDLDALCRSTVHLLRPLAKTAGTEIVVQGGAVEVAVNQAELQQVLSNLVTNAVHAMPDGGRIEVTTRVESARAPGVPRGSERDYALIVVRDQGTGIPADILPRIFDPFFTTKDVGKGTGLGLSVSYGIVRDHGGFIRVETRMGRGTDFFVHLPL